MSSNEAQVERPQQPQTPIEPQIPVSKYSKRVVLKTLLTLSDSAITELLGQRVVIGGWVKSSREFKKEPIVTSDAKTQEEKDHRQQQNKDVTCVEVLQTRLPFLRSIIKVFGGDHHHRVREKLDIALPKPTPQHTISILLVTDGSCISSLQVTVDSSLASPSHVMPTGTCIYAEGVLQKPSLQGKGNIELKAEKILHIGLVDMNTYPLSRKRLPLESLRDSTHFRPRTTTVASVTRIRNALMQAINSFYVEENDFLYVQVPVITSTHVEGFGQDFQVTTAGRRVITHGEDPTGGGIKPEEIKNSIREKAKKIDELKRSDSNKEAVSAAMQDLDKTKEFLSQIEAKQKQKLGNSEEYFSCRTYLTVTGRLHLESYASALGNVYTFGPRFLAHEHESRKLLAEMWLVEVEMAFSKLDDSMQCAVDFLKFICKWLLENCAEDLKFVSKRIDKSVYDRLNSVATAGEFEKVSYTEAVEVLKQATGGNFEPKVLKWGVQLNEEHESYLSDEVYKKPVIIYGHPKENVPFHVRVDDDLKTALSYDVILPKVGTVIRGSQNEDRFNVLTSRVKELGLDEEQIKWYLDLKKHGSVHCSGFSFLFDPMVLYATGLNDVRDAVPFPRSFRKADT